MPVITEERKTVEIEEKKPSRIKLSYIIAAAVPTLLTAAFYIICSLGHSQFIAEKIGMPIQGVLRKISAVFPFSVMEAVYCVLIAAAVLFIFSLIWITVKRKATVKMLLKRLFILVLVIFYIYTAFLYLWGVNYRVPSLAERNGFSSEGISAEDLFIVTAAFAYGANEFSDKVPRDESGAYIDDRSLYWDESVTLYDEFCEEFSYPLQPPAPAKEMRFSNLMSRIGFTGIYFAFTGESNINTAAPAMLTPFVIAHESAHQQGIAREQEANFAGIVTCLKSQNPVYIYAGYLDGLINLLNAIHAADEELWRQAASVINEQVRFDITQNNEYWASQRSSVQTAAETVYDGYLKANKQELGIKSYGACVDLLVQYFIDKVVIVEK